MVKAAAVESESIESSEVTADSEVGSSVAVELAVALLEQLEVL